MPSLTQRQIDILNDLPKYVPALRSSDLDASEQIQLGDTIQATEGGTTALAVVEAELLSLAGDETELSALAAEETALSALAAVNTALQRAALVEARAGVVLSGAAFVDISFTAARNGSPVVAMLNEADGTISIRSAVWQGAGVLRVTISANATADRDVSAIVYPQFV